MADLKLIAEFGANTKGLEKGLKEVERKLAGLEKANTKASKSADRLAEKTAQSRKALKQFAVVAGATALAIGVKSVKAFAKFEKGMAEVGTLTKFTAGEMRNMSIETLKLAGKFGQTIEVMTSARYAAVSAGFIDITEQTKLLTKANELAIAGVTDVKTGMDAITSVMNAYGKENISAAKASDILFGTVQAGKTTIPELNAALGKVLPTAAGVGVAFEEVGAALATMTAQGIQTPQAVTALNSALFAMAAPTSEAGRAMTKLGIQTVDTTGAMLPLVDVFAQFEGMSLAKIREIVPDKEAAKAILAAANNMDILRANTEKLANIAGVTQEAYSQMAQTTAQKLAVVNSSFEVLKTTFGAFITDTRSGVDVLGFVTGTMNEWTRLFSLNADGVSVLREEFALLADENGAELARRIAKTQQGLLAQEKKFRDKLEQFDNEQLRRAIEFSAEAGEVVVSDNEETQRKINQITNEIAAERVAAFKNTATDIATTFSDILDKFTSDSKDAAPATAKPISDSFTAEGQTVASGFSSLISGMGDTASSGLAGVMSPITGSMSNATQIAATTYSNFITNLKKEITLTVQIRTVQGSAEGGIVYGFAGGGIAPSDTVSAMLTPGEMVINREQTQKNRGLLMAINSGASGFAQGGMVQGFQGGGGVDFASILGTQGTLPAMSLDEFSESWNRAIDISNEATAKLADINDNFLSMVEDFQSDIVDVRLSGLEEQERIEAESAIARADIMALPFSEEQKEILLAQQQSLFDAEAELRESNRQRELDEIESAAIEKADKASLDRRIKNIQHFQQVSGQAFGNFFAAQISGQKDFNKASEMLFKQGGGAIIDTLVNQKVAEISAAMIAEEGKAGVEAPGTFGASLLKIPLILAAGAAAKAALGAIKFHDGGIVGGDIDAPPSDVPIIAQAGERVLSRDETQALEGGSATGPMTIIVPVNIDGEEVARIIERIGEQPNRSFT